MGASGLSGFVMNYPETGEGLMFAKVSDFAEAPTPNVGFMTLLNDGDNWWQESNAGGQKRLLTTDDLSGLIDGSGSAGQVAYFTDSDTIASDDDFTFDTTSGLVINDTGGSSVDLRVETDIHDHAIFVDASANTVNFGSDNSTTSASFLSSYFIAADDAGTVRAAKFWSKGHQTADASDLHVGFEVRVFYDIDSGKTNSGTTIGADFINFVDASISAGTLNIGEALRVEAGHIATGNSPTSNYQTCINALVGNSAGTIGELKGYRAHAQGGAGTTTLYVAYDADDGMGDEALGWRATNDLSEVWEWNDLSQITGNQTDYAIGDGRNISVTANGAYNIDGITHGVVANRDGRHVEIYNLPGSNTLTIINNSGGGGSAASGNKIFTTTAANLSLGVGQVLEMKFKQSLDSGNGAWIAWVK